MNRGWAGSRRSLASAWVCAMAATLSVTAAAAGKAAKPPATVGDLSPRQVDIRPEQRVEASAERAIDNYRRYLEQEGTDPEQRAEALRRLGDLNLEVGELERIESEVSAVDRAGAEAIELYTTLLEAHPDYPRNDQVLYQLARAYETTGQPDKALATLDQMVARYPELAQRDEVEFRRGEILFSAQRYAEAEQAYQRALERGPDGAFYSQSLYKHGWSLFKQGRNEESLPSFARVLDANLTDPVDGRRLRAIDKMSRPDRELVEDSLRVMSITFSYLDGAASVDQFITRHGGPPYSYLLYARLGDLYVEKQRYQDAADAYRAFVAREPADENAPLLAMQAIEAYRKGGFDQLVLEGKRDYVERYNFAGSFWQARQRADYPQVVAELKTNMKDVATYYHATAQKSKRADDFQAAARWYRDYLGSFPDDPESAATNYLLAETLFESGNYADAAIEYQRTAYDYPTGPKSAEAAYAALGALEKQRTAAAAGPARDEVVAHQVEAGIRFAQAFPEHPDSGGVITRAAQDVFDRKDLPRAIEIANLVLAHQPPVDAAKQRVAWTIIGQASFEQGDFLRAEAAYQQARELAPANDPLRRDLSERLAASVYKQAEERRSEGDSAGAVDAFLRAAALSPDPAVRATAEFDAAAQLLTLKQWERAIPVLESYRRNYPRDARQGEVTRNLAVAYGEAGRAGEAAAEFERIAANPAEEREVRREALQSAADLYAKAGDRARSAAVLERFVKEFPLPLGPAVEARQRLAEYAQASGNAARLEFWQREIVKADANAGAERTDRTRYLAGKAQLALATPARDAFRKVRLVAPLNKSLTAKRKALDTALQAYRNAVDYRVNEVTAAATYEMAELYRTLGRDVMASERPRGLSADEREQYDTLLEEQAFPFEEQSIELHLVNAARIRDGYFDDSVQRSYAALAEFKPARYGKTEIGTDLAVRLATAAPRVRETATEALSRRTAGDLAAAQQGLQQAAEQAGSDPALWTELGLVQRLRAELEGARASYGRALAADPGYVPALRNLAVLLDLYMDDPVQALPYFEQCQAASGEDKQLNSWLIDVRQRAGRAGAATTPAAGEGGAAGESDTAPAGDIAPPAAARLPQGAPTERSA
ncbi:MAG: tetratricopeptide repeat protein [Steroidobacteraceae bacterium]|nr:tetratricopeptide repeat protein [Nevskiaceae bacterium]MCP5338935.1 tetratricopeptide repeat protein [Nevskiaceae bacterium]MCP5359652.1 tetratricopeptide repeat protein [Nevskiaceae bacterium]MCP5472554.1 tetratricopeptide repeat protein [Nevskiaceae bacterium]